MEEGRSAAAGEDERGVPRLQEGAAGRKSIRRRVEEMGNRGGEKKRGWGKISDT
jgi:hypothetical protein